MKTYTKRGFPVWKARQLLEPGPVVLVSSAWKGEMNIMTLGWHTIMEFSPSRIGCFITAANHSYELIRKSRECVINLPTADMAGTVVGIGNTSGREIDKFSSFGLTPVKPLRLKAAPLIKECYANFECRVTDTSLLNTYSFFILEVVRSIRAVSPKEPVTLHYKGEGKFMVSGKTVDLHKKFRPGNL